MAIYNNVNGSIFETNHKYENVNGSIFEVNAKYQNVNGNIYQTYGQMIPLIIGGRLQVSESKLLEYIGGYPEFLYRQEETGTSTVPYRYYLQSRNIQTLKQPSIDTSLYKTSSVKKFYITGRVIVEVGKNFDLSANLFVSYFNEPLENKGTSATSYTLLDGSVSLETETLVGAYARRPDDATVISGTISTSLRIFGDLYVKP